MPHWKVDPKLKCKTWRVRDAPDAKAKEVAVLNAGEEIEELEKKGDWVKHAKGWSMVKAGGVTALLPVQYSSKGQEAPPPAARASKKRREYLQVDPKLKVETWRVRSKPDTSAQQVGLVNAGDVLEVLEKKGDWIRHHAGWSIIKAGGVTALIRLSPPSLEEKEEMEKAAAEAEAQQQKEEEEKRKQEEAAAEAEKEKQKQEQETREAEERERKKKEEEERKKALEEAKAKSNGNVQIRYEHYNKTFQIKEGSMTAAAIDDELCVSFVMPKCKIHLSKATPAEWAQAIQEERALEYLPEMPEGTFHGLETGQEYFVYVEEDKAESKKAFEENKKKWQKAKDEEKLKAS
uniref:SH3b domain-containing protein n=1 Tax=Chromera velia CCMP2878 TaxID=1169474 RepID=A0A0G4HCL6_9ALVE|eukprot:Cvel_26147.t1-p1 / transcript=Cvel_26147.t1 / gene=Cvel_26147 / organism=Chromera_velia_CCMP2878 / gene_product=hypothetical protein / transcript_product=hypothetical protein / location=Cvel_scaffold3065:15583-20477(+) / protein_length=347 / sequence_SO=supercontig / SO=protein_coding / is_pseudo=false